MTLAYSNSHQHTFFNPAQVQFESMISHLESSAAKYNEHGKVEDYIDVEGTEVLRCLFQGYLNKRAAEELRQQIYSDDGTHLTHLKSSQRNLESLFGQVVAPREGYSQRGYSSQFPVHPVNAYLPS